MFCCHQILNYLSEPACAYRDKISTRTLYQLHQGLRLNIEHCCYRCRNEIAYYLLFVQCTPTQSSKMLMHCMTRTKSTPPQTECQSSTCKQALCAAHSKYMALNRSGLHSLVHIRCASRVTAGLCHHSVFFKRQSGQRWLCCQRMLAHLVPVALAPPLPQSGHLC